MIPLLLNGSLIKSPGKDVADIKSLFSKEVLSSDLMSGNQNAILFSGTEKMRNVQFFVNRILEFFVEMESGEHISDEFVFMGEK